MSYLMNPDMNDVKMMMCEIVQRGFVVNDKEGRSLSYDREMSTFTVKDVNDKSVHYAVDYDNDDLEEADFDTSTALKAINNFLKRD